VSRSGTDAAIDAPVFLTARWSMLAMLNFEIDPVAVAPLVPGGTELDSFNGRTYVSVVGFRFLNTRLKGVAVPFHRDFDEINLRYYVRRKDGDGWKRGVAFVREVVPRRAIAYVARWIYGERYVARPTRSDVRTPVDGGPGSVAYEWRDQRDWLALRASIVGEPTKPDEGSQEEFITEHYWGYASTRRGATVEYRVEHPQWALWDATNASVEGPLDRFYGPEFAEALSAPPASAFIAEGSDVTVRDGRRID